jgi:hypothetical protein
MRYDGPLSTNPHEGLLPQAHSLAVYPNPFNATATVQFELPVRQHVELRLFDLLGREVQLLKDELTAAGSHRIFVDGMNLSSGRYFVRLATPSFSTTSSVTLLK